MTHRLAALAAIASLSLAWAAPAQAQDARYLAANCANCHGTEGRASAGAGMPGLAGLSRTYFIEQMNAFRSGARVNAQMSPIAAKMSDKEIKAVSDYIAGLR